MQRYGRRPSGGLRDVCLCGAVTLAAVVVLTTALLLGPAFSRRAVYAAMARPPPSSRRRRRLDDVLSSASTPVGWSSIVSGTEMEFYMQRIESPAPIHSHAAVILASPAPPFWTAVVMGGVNAKRHAIFGQTMAISTLRAGERWTIAASHSAAIPARKFTTSVVLGSVGADPHVVLFGGSDETQTLRGLHTLRFATDGSVGDVACGSGIAGLNASRDASAEANAVRYDSLTNNSCSGEMGVLTEDSTIRSGNLFTGQRCRWTLSTANVASRLFNASRPTYATITFSLFDIGGRSPTGATCDGASIRIGRVGGGSGASGASSIANATDDWRSTTSRVFSDVYVGARGVETNFEGGTGSYEASHAHRDEQLKRDAEANVVHSLCGPALGPHSDSAPGFCPARTVLLDSLGVDAASAAAAAPAQARSSQRRNRAQTVQILRGRNISIEFAYDLACTSHAGFVAEINFVTSDLHVVETTEERTQHAVPSALTGVLAPERTTMRRMNRSAEQRGSMSTDPCSCVQCGTRFGRGVCRGGRCCCNRGWMGPQCGVRCDSFSCATQHPSNITLITARGTDVHLTSHPGQRSLHSSVVARSSRTACALIRTVISTVDFTGAAASSIETASDTQSSAALLVSTSVNGWQTVSASERRKIFPLDSEEKQTSVSTLAFDTTTAGVLKMFVFGGWDGVLPSSEVWEYSSATQQEGTLLSTRRAGEARAKDYSESFAPTTSAFFRNRDHNGAGNANDAAVFDPADVGWPAVSTLTSAARVDCDVAYASASAFASNTPSSINCTTRDPYGLLSSNSEAASAASNDALLSTSHQESIAVSATSGQIGGWRAAKLATPMLKTVPTWRRIIPLGAAAASNATAAQTTTPRFVLKSDANAASFPVARYGHVAVVLGRIGGNRSEHYRMVVFGGRSASRLMADVWSFSLESTAAADGIILPHYTWRAGVAVAAPRSANSAADAASITPQPSAREMHAAAVAAGRVWIYGGFDGYSHVLNDLWSFAATDDDLASVSPTWSVVWNLHSVAHAAWPDCRARLFPLIWLGVQCTRRTAEGLPARYAHAVTVVATSTAGAVALSRVENGDGPASPTTSSTAGLALLVLGGVAPFSVPASKNFNRYGNFEGGANPESFLVCLDATDPACSSLDGTFVKANTETPLI